MLHIRGGTHGIFFVTMFRNFWNFFENLKVIKLVTVIPRGYFDNLLNCQSNLWEPSSTRGRSLHFCPHPSLSTPGFPSIVFANYAFKTQNSFFSFLFKKPKFSPALSSKLQHPPSPCFCITMKFSPIFS